MPDPVVTYSHSNEEDTVRDYDVSEVYDGTTMRVKVRANTKGDGWLKTVDHRPLQLSQLVDDRRVFVTVDVAKATLDAAADAVSAFVEDEPAPGTRAFNA